jgi:hypothetical protein
LDQPISKNNTGNSHRRQKIKDQYSLSVEIESSPDRRPIRPPTEPQTHLLARRRNIFPSFAPTVPPISLKNTLTGHPWKLSRCHCHSSYRWQRLVQDGQGAHSEPISKGHEEWQVNVFFRDIGGSCKGREDVSTTNE